MSVGGNSVRIPRLEGGFDTDDLGVSELEFLGWQL
jgi:hypothetical protein